MNRYKTIILSIAAGALLQGCSKYTDVKTAGTLTPGQYTNFRYLMNNTDVLERAIDMPDMTADDIEYKDISLQQSLSNEYLRAYTWDEQYYDVTTPDPDWQQLYQSNYYCNLVIQDVMNSNGGTAALKSEVMAEARVHRAYNYLTLVNMYAKQYNEATKATDPGVPLLLQPDVSATAVRTTVAAVYDNIFSDLQAAIANLPEENTYNIYPSKAAAYALLARAYLQTGNYTNAGIYADSALAIQHTLLDLPTLGSYPMRISNPEIILSKTARSNHTYSARQVLSSTLLALYDTTDYRYSNFTADYVLNGQTYRVNAKEQVTGSNRNIGPSVPEMLLIKAEAAARAGQTAAAMDAVNTLRAKRFSAADYTPLTANNADNALVLVLQERRRELCFSCIRWFDQKRLFTEARFAKDITRTNLVTGTSYTLKPGSNRYIFPIPQYNIQLNPALEQNPR